MTENQPTPPSSSQPKRLLLVDGIPGSGKTTTATRIHDKLAAQGIRTRCLLELEEHHPLLPQNEQYGDLQSAAGAEIFIQQLVNRYSRFVQAQLNGPDEVIIIESVLFQDVISVSHLQGMNLDQLRGLTDSLLQLLAPLNPHLIYYYHTDVEGQWRFICSVRGNEWGPVSFQSDEDFVQAGEVWSRSQAFVRTAVDAWDIPKLVIENTDYQWSAYDAKIDGFLTETLLPAHAGE
ncbi:hypothetical protein GZH47_26935 [Paenibacillus rhizovicinus]|uniref:Uncharacterized protein n=1 Tax=Paenibacillus rhizovicinus TaxID=2704463 RepID=A0A6C0P6C3_9BACL|nr:hypothetical protein [Paenibacillus rhizovicinus]QHW34069.1 hypothetical protein GZH47_26935 [Paenibacillus rhizovicinus]